MDKKKILFHALQHLEKAGYRGIGSLKYSLLKDGFICKEYELEIHCIYGIKKDKNGDYITFDQGTISKFDLDTIFLEECINKEKFFQLYLINEDTWKNLPYLIKIHDIIKFAGANVVLGHPSSISIPLIGLLGLSL